MASTADVTGISRWDWRWRAPFDPTVKAAVEREARHLSEMGFAAEAAVLDTTLRLALEHASVGGLLFALEDEEDLEQRERLIAHAADLPLNGFPSEFPELLRHWAERVALDANENDRLAPLVRRALRTRWVEPHTATLEAIFGATRGDVVTFAESLRARRPQSRPLGPRLDPAAARDLVDRYVQDRPALAARLPSFAVRWKASEGFGAWWPEELTGAPDHLEMSLNDDSLHRRAFEETLAHEVSGHGVWYELLRRRPPVWVDHGAVAVLEGWATFAEWILPHDHGPDGSRLSWLGLIGADASTLATDVPQVVARQGYSPKQGETALATWLQVPAYQISYLLGGLWFLQRAGSYDEGLLLLDRLFSAPVGDFFALRS